MFKNPILLTVITCGIFFFLATATSKEIPNFPLNLSVTLADSNLILSNNDTFDYVASRMTLARMTGEIVLQSEVTEYYRIHGYSLVAGSTDSVPLNNFMKDSSSYPVDKFPQSFSISVNTVRGEGSFRIEF